MERLKSIFISVFVAFVVGGVIYTLIQIFQRVHIEAGFCNLIILCTAFFYFALIFLNPIPRTSKHLPVLTLSTIIGLAGNLYFNFQSLHWPSLVLGILGFLGWLVYTYWGSGFGERKQSLLKKGQPFPEVSFKDIKGNQVSTSQFKGSSAVILFYRGNWCPFCMAQIRELAKEYQQIEEKGAKLIFISPQSAKHTESLAKKFDIPATFLIDENLNASKELGLFNAYGTPFGMEVLGYSTDNVYPTLVITDSNGIVRFINMTDNYRLRPEPSSYIKLIDEVQLAH